MDSFEYFSSSKSTFVAAEKEETNHALCPGNREKADIMVAKADCESAERELTATR